MVKCNFKNSKSPFNYSLIKNKSSLFKVIFHFHLNKSNIKLSFYNLLLKYAYKRKYCQYKYYVTTNYFRIKNIIQNMLKHESNIQIKRTSYMEIKIPVLPSISVVQSFLENQNTN